MKYKPILKVLLCSGPFSSITVTGIGDQDSFLKFLQNYNFAGGRLITAEKIEFNKGASGTSNLVLNFYNKKVSSTEDQSVSYEKVLEKISQIRSKVNIALQSEEAAANTSYPVGTNPF